MESQSAIDELNLPFGYKFKPTDVELLDYYLVSKLKGEKLPSDYVMDIDVYRYDPHQLPLNQFKHAKENQAHFFTEDLKKTAEEEGRLVRNAPNGCWKVYEDSVPVCRADNETIGFKTKLLFYNSDGHKTNWKMIEYRCHPTKIPTGSRNRYIVCKVKQKKKMEEGLVEESPEEENGTNGGNQRPETST